MQLLARHDDAVFVSKPSGQLVHNSAWAGPRERSLVEDVRAECGRDLSPIHRLDRGASGVVLFAADAARWQAALAGARKIYLALVRGHPLAAVDVDHPVKDENGVAQPAKSRVTPLARAAVERVSLVSIELFSGRHHQARRHLSHLSHPVIGDATHGKGAINRDLAARFGLARLALHAWVLDVGGLRVTAPLPDDLAAPLALLFSAEALRGALAGERAL